MKTKTNYRIGCTKRCSEWRVSHLKLGCRPTRVQTAHWPARPKAKCGTAITTTRAVSRRSKATGETYTSHLSKPTALSPLTRWKWRRYSSYKMRDRSTTRWMSVISTWGSSWRGWRSTSWSILLRRKLWLGKKSSSTKPKLRNSKSRKLSRRKKRRREKNKDELARKGKLDKIEEEEEMPGLVDGQGNENKTV